MRYIDNILEKKTSPLIDESIIHVGDKINSRRLHQTAGPMRAHSISSIATLLPSSVLKSLSILIAQDSA